MAATRGFLLSRVLWMSRSLLPEFIPAASRADIGRATASESCHRHSSVRRRCHGRDEAVRLAYTHYKPDDTAKSTTLPPIIVLHGLFGCRRNWDAVSPAVARATGRNVFAVDLRNHGDSPHSDHMDYPLMRADLELFFRDRGFSRVSFVGHSMGGRVAMSFAVNTPDVVERLVVVDIAPSYLPPALTAQWLPWQIQAMETILWLLSPHMSLDQARQVADQFLSSQITKPYVREFLLTNLRKGPRMFEWQLNLKAIKQNLKTVTALDYLDNGGSDVDTLFISGEDSIYIHAEGHEALKQSFPNARIVAIKGTSHFVYKDKPEEFVNLVRDFMSEASSGVFEEKEEFRAEEPKIRHVP
ncbi:hypothetical protein V5799_029317 [Amblyomma americanum]|uniref:sn-1-specific diacylglycerol lipase ABHD11 n=1 Tax=Amblyomma americanum TaxID=6943 RepID=A0AAQ4ERK1_AMBAM